MSDVLYITLRARDGSVRGTATIDAVDDQLLKHRWHLHTAGYVVRNISLDGGKRGVVLLHRNILGLEPGDRRQADHINRDKLDNRRANLRIVTDAQNKQNVAPEGRATYAGEPTASRYRGVSWHKGAAKWQVGIRLRGKRHHVGFFDSEREAAEAATNARRQAMTHTTN